MTNTNQVAPTNYTFYDVEVYPNIAFIVTFDYDTKKFSKIDLRDTDKLQQLFSSKTIFGYNSSNYDNHMIAFVLEEERSYPEIYEFSKSLISGKHEGDLKNFNWAYKLQKLTDNWQIADLAVMYGLMEQKGIKRICKSLKSLGVKLGFGIQNSPYDFDKPIKNQESLKAVVGYCKHDVEITVALFNAHSDQNKVREYLKTEYDLGNVWKKESSITHDIFKRYIKTTNDSPVQSLSSPIIWDSTIELPQETLDTFKYNCISGGCFMLDGIDLSFGMGGLHSVNKDFVEEDVIDLDVASFYPNLIGTLEIVPASLDREKFLEDFGSIITKRIKLKNEGKKIESNAYKLLLNSTFGQFGNEYSKFFDLNANRSVTLNGQLMLIELINMMLAGGHQVICANTDGISIKKKDDSYKDIVTAWSVKHRLTMEEMFFKKLYMRDINNYIALMGDGKIKCKGDFSEPSFTNTRIPAVYKCYIKFAEIGIVRENCDTIKEYLKSLPRTDFVCVASNYNPKTDNNDKVTYVIGKDKTSHFKKIDKNGRFSKVKDSEGATIDGEIDYDAYFKIVYEKISIFFDNKDFYDAWSDKLPLINKGAFKKNLSGFKSSDKTTWKTTRYSSSYSAVCGDGLVCIDVDDPENFHYKEAFDALNTLKVYREGSLKCAYFFKVSPSQVNVKTLSIKKSPIAGAEVLYEGTNKIVYGLHEDGSNYLINGEIVADLPEDIYKMFKVRKLSTKKKEVNEDPTLDMSLLRERLSEDGDILKFNDNWIDVMPRHIDIDRPVRLFVTGNRITFNCFNKNHEDEISDWVKSISCDRRIDVIDLESTPSEEKFEGEIANQDIPNYSLEKPTGDILNILFSNEDEIVSIEKPTGGGKTYQIGQFAIHRLKEGMSTTVLFPTKCNLFEFKRYLLDYSASLEKDIMVLTADTKSDFRTYDDAPKIYLTEHIYFTRKGFSTGIYNYARKFLEVKDNFMVIDEAHLFIKSLKFNILNNLPFYKSGEKGYNRAWKAMKSITSAKKEIETFGVLLQHNFFGVEIANDIPFLSNPSSCVMKDYPIESVKEFDDYQTKIEFFKDSKVLNTKSRLNLDDYFLPEYETNDTTLTHDEILEDIISFSRETMKFSNFVKTIKANGEVTRIYDCDTLKNYKLEKDEEEYSSYSPICTTAFVGIDYLPIHCFTLLNQKYNTRFAFLTATATKELENALDYMGAKRFSLPGTFRKLDVLRLVKIRHIESIDEKGIRSQSVHSKIDFKPRKQETYKLYNIFNHSLLFSPNKGDVIKDKNQKITNFLYYNEGNYLNSIFECNKREIPIITYSGSSIGTGANFPDRHTVIIDSKYRCNPQGLNSSMLKVAQDIAEVSHLSGNEQMKQNVGRILRVDLKEPVLTKTIVLNNVDFDCEYFKELCEKLEVYEIDVCRVELDKTVNYELYSLCSLISDGLKSPGKYDIFDKNIHNDVYFANKIIDGDLTALDVVYETDNSKNKNPTIPNSTPDEFKIALHIHKNGFPSNIQKDLSDVVKGLTHSKKLKEITEFVNTLKTGRITK